MRLPGPSATRSPDSAAVGGAPGTPTRLRAVTRSFLTWDWVSCILSRRGVSHDTRRPGAAVAIDEDQHMTTTSPASGLSAERTGTEFPAGTVEPDYVLTEALGTDPASLFTGISAEDRAYWDRARSFVQDEVLPVIDGYWERAEYPLQLLRRLGELDLLRDGVAVEGFAPMSSMAAGLVNMEISRGDGSVATMIAVQGGLALRSVAECGSTAQQERWLPAIAKGTEYAAFAL